jgi:hypothetical protein
MCADSAGVRFGAHSGFKLDIARGPFRANKTLMRRCKSDKIQSEEVCRLVGIIGLGARSAVASGRSTGSRAILGCNSLRSRKTSA